MVGHQAVRKNCEPLRGCRTQKLFDCMRRGGIVDECRAAIFSANRQEISVRPEVREVGDPARLRHDRDGFASEVPEPGLMIGPRYEARSKDRAYVRILLRTNANFGWRSC